MARRRRSIYNDIMLYYWIKWLAPYIAIFLIFIIPGYIIYDIFIGSSKKDLDMEAIFIISLLFWVFIAVLVILWYIKQKNKEEVFNISSPKFKENPSKLEANNQNELMMNEMKNRILANKCPLVDEAVELTIKKLKQKNSEYDFDTFDFVENCIGEEEKCPVRKKIGNRKVCGSRLGEYRTTTKKIIDPYPTSGSRGRKWKINNENSIRTVSNFNSESATKSSLISFPPPVTRGHKLTADWIKTDSFKEIKNSYDKVFGHNNVYFRITDRGVTAISLDTDCPGLLGINCPGLLGISSSRDSKECYIDLYSYAKPINEYELLKRQFNYFKSTVRRISIEEQTVIKYLNSVFKNNLRLPGFSQNYCFLNNEWRFLDFEGKGKKSDILAVNINSSSLVIIEFKDSSSKIAQAREQLRSYMSYYERFKNIYNEYFTKQLNSMGILYGIPEMINTNVNWMSTELYFAYPGIFSPQFIKLN